jgi:hypothetical protein
MSHPVSDKQSVTPATLCLSANIAAQIEQRALGRRKLVRHGGLLCSRCLEQPPAGAVDRYCHGCRAAYNRDRRKAEREELKRLRAAHGETLE